MNIVAYWKLPPSEQEPIRVNNPITKCSICGKAEIRLISCDACGEDVCFSCAVPCNAMNITRDGLEEVPDGIILCKKCGEF